MSFVAQRRPTFLVYFFFLVTPVNASHGKHPSDVCTVEVGTFKQHCTFMVFDIVSFWEKLIYIVLCSTESCGQYNFGYVVVVGACM